MTDKAPEGKVLTDKQARFVDEYLIDSNGAYAAIRAGYSEKTAPQKACALLKEPHIKAAIDKGRAKIAKRNDLTIDDLLAELEQARVAALTAENPQSSAAVAATMGKAKMLGLLIDRAETKTEGSISINIGFE